MNKISFDETYLEAHKFFNLERWMKINKNESVETFRENIRVSVKHKVPFRSQKSTSFKKLVIKN